MRREMNFRSNLASENEPCGTVIPFTIDSRTCLISESRSIFHPTNCWNPRGKGMTECNSDLASMVDGSLYVVFQSPRPVWMCGRRRPDCP